LINCLIYIQRGNLALIWNLANKSYQNLTDYFTSIARYL